MRNQLMDAEARFWSKVDKASDCWMWTGFLTNGYGHFWLNSRKIRAHRFSWILSNGDIPDGLIVCHHCDNPKCVNPSHLFLGTHSDNTQDCVRKGRNSKDPYWLKEVKGSQKPNAKLSEAIVMEIRSRPAIRGYQKAMAKQYMVSEQVIAGVLKRKIWTHVA